MAENNKSNREFGSNFDKDEANEIFDKLDKINSDDSKKVDKNIASIKDVTELLKEAKNTDESKAIELYKKVLVIMPENLEAYIGLADIYRKQDDRESERDILKKAIQNVDGSSKNDLMKRLKEIS
ncbi:lipopolysaccharide assembly protein LapB [Methanobrevibacter sp.]|uniref:tetratricopeptide repeat protein n=1 Tax=Methanobrevibacter sp. TaxID=66852 RepID=UPI0025CC52FE|nr:tetratricopeptide repeat protein [Methanobrevibacter sp.]MEE0943002.1 tetratricopeptide repeat protein [Methanobrevibacter sp.]